MKKFFIRFASNVTPDKYYHAIVGCVVSSLLFIFPAYVVYSLLLITAIGKEIRDYYSYGYPSLDDFAYTLAGSVPVTIAHSFLV